VTPNSPSLLMPLNDYPYDIVCMDCDQPIPYGSPYSLRLETIDVDGEEWGDVVCATGYCKLAA
jgi:hypothetical protein